MPACGNPEIPASVVQTNVSCHVLNEAPVDGQANAFAFTASADKTGDASIVKYIYNFGDGSPTVTESDGSAQVTHTYKTPGTFTASVTVIASVPGNPGWQLPLVSMCTKQVAVTPPPAPQGPQTPSASCQQLIRTPQDDNKMGYTFSATTEPTSNGATLVSADFSFGDDTNQPGIASNGATAGAVVTTHRYAAAGTYTATAVLHYAGSDGWQGSSSCSAVVTAANPPVAAAPTMSLPNTGAGDVIGIFLGTFMVGTICYRLLQHRKLSRSDLIK
jgi:hypothetical protein